MRRIFLCIFFTGLCYTYTNASLVSKDTTDSSKENVTSVIAGSNYSTNTNTFGRFDKFTSQPSFSPYVTYLSRYKFDVGAVGYFIGNSDANSTGTTSELDLQAGYTWELGSVFSVNPTYTHFFYSSNSGVLKKSYSDLVQLNLDADVSWWNNTISARYLWGEYDEIDLSAQTGVNITLSNVIWRGNSLVFGPLVELNLSNINYYRYISGDYKFLREYAAAYPDATVNDLIYDLENSPRRFIRRLAARIDSTRILKKRLNLLEVDGNFVISQLFNTQKELKISNLGLTLPLYYYAGNFVFTASFAAYKPYNQPKIFGNDWTTYFEVGLSYTFGNHGQNSFK